MTAEPCSLGIDLGTTSVKVTVLNITTQEVVCSFTQKSSADIESSYGKLGSEQNPQKIVEELEECLKKVPIPVQERVTGIGVSGQMHGVMLWKSSDAVKSASMATLEMATSPLYTWMDQRCTPEFLATLPSPSSHLKLCTGHGCATLFWLSRQGEITQYDCAGSVMDYVVSKLCALERPVTSTQVAASFGYFNTEDRTWNVDILKDNGFPVHLLPRVVSPGKVAGHLCSTFGHLSQNIPVFAALGDVQCAFLSVLEHPQDAVLNLGTSVQIGYISKGHNSSSSKWLYDRPETVEYFPYFEDEYLALSAGLNGGNVLQHFVTTVQKWFAEFGFSMSDKDIWSKLLRMAEQCDEPTLSIKPTLYGERHQPSLRASVTGLSIDNTSLAELFKAACYGVIDNLQTLMSVEFLLDNGNVKRLLASGSVVSNNPILCKRLETVYRKIPIIYGTPGDSALGAAKIVQI